MKTNSDPYQFVLGNSLVSKDASILIKDMSLQGTQAGDGFDYRQNFLLFKPAVQSVKRVVDFISATLGLLLLWPVFIFLAVLICRDSPGPALYAQWRIGKGGKPFKIWKFRTMFTQAGQILDEHLREDPTLRDEWNQYQKLRNDPRLTRLGRFMRRYSLDELPQLLNVFRGEMGMVGPRPFFAEQQDAYSLAYPLYICQRPGITGLWQVSGRNNASFAERVALDSTYAHLWSLGLELRIWIRTIWVVISGEGAF
jgi:lipopolysaccharide/colanic/teichoic acid biosynthesis glycosyltransferase